MRISDWSSDVCSSDLLTLRTFHVGGTASNIAAESQIIAKFNGKLEFENIRTVGGKSADGSDIQIVIGRSGEVRIIDESLGKVVMNNNVPYGAHLFVKEGQELEKGELICSWDPYNAVMVSDFAGKVEFESVLEGVTFREESDEQTGHREKVIIDTRDKTKNPVISVIGKKGQEKSYNIQVGAHIIVENGESIKAGQVLVKIPRAAGKTRDITGGLPRVTALFEARNPSNPAVVTELDGVVTLGGSKRGHREIIIQSKDGQTQKYLEPLYKHILIQDNVFVKAGTSLSDGAISPADILAIKGPGAVQEYLVNEVQEVYRLQGVKINDKHFEVIVHQMMQKVTIDDPGDTRFLEKESVSKIDFMEENDWIYEKKDRKSVV